MDLHLWHGTHTVFDQFSLNYHGDGEGSNSFGKAVYLATSRDNALRYANNANFRHGKGYLYQVRIEFEVGEIIDFSSTFCASSQYVRMRTSKLMRGDEYSICFEKIYDNVRREFGDSDASDLFVSCGIVGFQATHEGKYSIIGMFDPARIEIQEIYELPKGGENPGDPLRGRVIASYC